MILTTINSGISYQKPPSHIIYLWNKADLQGMSQDMLSFASEFTHTNTIDTPIEDLWSSLQTKLLDTVNAHVPCKVKSNNTQQPWVNCTLKQLRRQKQ